MEQQLDPWALQSGSLEQRHQNLLRVSKAMWVMLKSKLNLSDGDLLAMVQAAAPAQAQLTECTICSRPMQSTARCCLYCGTAPRVEAVELRSANLNVTRHAAQ